MNKNPFDFLMRKVLFLSAIFFLTVLFSCKKDGKLSPDFDNGNLSVLFTDTFSINTSLVKEDSLRTDLVQYHLLGIYNDLIFGPKSASIYTNVSLSGYPMDFGSSVIIDSVVLSLDYVDFYGDTNSPLQINVYELNNPLDVSTDYYSNTYTSSQSTLLGSTVFNPYSQDSIFTLVDSVTHKPHLRINISDPTLIADLVANSPYNDNAAFNAIFSGLHIVTNDTATFPSPTLPETGAITYLDMNSSVSGITVYYKNSTADSLQEKFLINSETKTYSRFLHDYTGTDIEAHLGSLPSKNTTVTYLSAMAGVKTKIEIPNIKELAKEGNVIINKAELIFTIETGTEGDNHKNAISNLSLVEIDANGDSFFLMDYFEGPDFFGGTLTDQGSRKTYTFNIARHIHKLVYNPNTDYGMYLVGNSSSVTANRSIISSENSSAYKIKLEITYSKL